MRLRYSICAAVRTPTCICTARHGMLQLTKRLYFRASGASQVFQIHRRPKSNTSVSSSSIVSTCASPPSGSSEIKYMRVVVGMPQILQASSPSKTRRAQRSSCWRREWQREREGVETRKKRREGEGTGGEDRRGEDSRGGNSPTPEKPVFVL